jgi:hypothetical protein
MDGVSRTVSAYDELAIAPCQRTPASWPVPYAGRQTLGSVLADGPGTDAVTAHHNPALPWGSIAWSDRMKGPWLCVTCKQDKVKTQPHFPSSSAAKEEMEPLR